MKATRLIPLLTALSVALLPGCDMLSPLAGTGSDVRTASADPELDAFLSEEALPDEDSEGPSVIKGLAGRLPASLIPLTVDPIGDLQPGQAATFSARPAPGQRLNFAWAATTGSTLSASRGNTVKWTPHRTKTSALRLTGTSSRGGKTVTYVVAFTNGKVVKLKEVAVHRTLPAGWLAENNPFKQAAPQATPTPAPAVIRTPEPIALPTNVEAENVVPAPTCDGAAPSGLDKGGYYTRYFELDKEGRYAEAVCLLKEGTAAHPEEHYMLFYMGVALFNMQSYGDGLKAMEKAYAMAPQETYMREHLAVKFERYAFRLAWEQSKWQDSLPWYDKATATMPAWAGYWGAYGIAARNAKDHARAYMAFQKGYSVNAEELVRDHGVNLKASVRDGVAALREDGRTDLAIAYAELGAKAFPQEGEFQSLLVSAYMATGQTDRAQAAVDALPPGNTRSLLSATILLGQSRDDEAAAAFQALSAANPTDFELDKAIAGAYRTKLVGLAYDAQMASPYHDKVFAFETSSVEKYFQLNPYNQTKTFYPPLRGSFCIGQGGPGKSYHYGLDSHYAYDMSSCSGSSMGVSIYAIGDGVVKSCNDDNPDQAIGAPVDLKARGNGIEIDHGDGIQSTYYHIKQGSLRVRVGDRVSADTVIAEIGNSGISGGPHLHFAVHDDKAALPARFTGLSKDDGTPMETMDDFTGSFGEGP